MSREDEIALLISKIEEVRRFFVPLVEKSPEWDWPRESLIACDVLLILLRQPTVDPNHCAWLARVIAREFSWSHPPFVRWTALAVLEWARQQEDIIKYRRTHGFAPIIWTTEAP